MVGNYSADVHSTKKILIELRKKMEIDSSKQQLIDVLDETRSFKKNKTYFTLFYVSSCATISMFIIIIILLSYSVSIAEDIHSLTSKGGAILDDIQKLLPIVQKMCIHENFTKSYGNICGE